MGYTIKLSAGDTDISAKGFFLKDGRILLVKPTGSEDKYDIPGGKIKMGESKEQGLFRECHEEVGLRITKVKLLGEDKERKKVYYVISQWNGEIVLQLEEIEKYRWVPVNEAINYSLTRTAYNGLVHYLLIELNGRV